MIFVHACPRETQEMVFDAHERAFALFKGACTRGIYDNMKTAAETIFIGKDRQYNRRFLQMAPRGAVRDGERRIGWSGYFVGRPFFFPSGLRDGRLQACQIKAAELGVDRLGLLGRRQYQPTLYRITHADVFDCPREYGIMLTHLLRLPKSRCCGCR